MPCAFQYQPAKNRPLVKCQFGFPEGELIDVEAEKYCRFHAPPLDNGLSRFPEHYQREISKELVDHINHVARLGKKIDLTGVVVGEGGSDILDAIANSEQGSAIIRNAVFTDPISADRLNFRRIDFSESTFHAELDFTHSKFNGAATFWGVKFQQVDFSQAQFNSYLDFSAAEFGLIAAFQGTEFIVGGNFRDSNFCSLADFSGCKFSRTLNFAGCRFAEGLVCGAQPSLRQHEIRSNPPIDGTLDFENAFIGYADFSGRTFKHAAKFDGAIFNGLLVCWGAELHEGTRFPTIANFKDTTSADAPAAYRNLKLQMEKFRARDEEAMFFALEMKSRRRQKDTPLAVKAFSLGYEWLSDYGQSLFRPLAWLLGITFVAGSLYWHMGNVALENLSPASLFALDQLARPFIALTSEYPEKVGLWGKDLLSDFPFWVRTIAALQSALSLGAITLFLLALRRRFKME